jgi:hypothetical protein
MITNIVLPGNIILNLTFNSDVMEKNIQKVKIIQKIDRNNFILSCIFLTLVTIKREIRAI